MTGPLSLIPFALAAGGGSVDGVPAAQLVAAGFTLLQRSAPLVRALSGRRSAILLPASGAFVTALAASDGRGAVFVDPHATPADIDFLLSDANVGAVFTSRALAARVPALGLPVVLLDDAPRTATVVTGGGATVVDLGSHFGLALEGEAEPGRDEECAIVYTSAMAGTPLGVVLTHRNLLANARGAVDALSLHAGDDVLAALPFSCLLGFTVTLAAPLLAGARVMTTDGSDPLETLDRVASEGITVLVGVPAMYAGWLDAIERRDAKPTSMPRVCLCAGSPLTIEIQDRWFDATGTELRQGYGLAEAGALCLFNVPHYPNRRGTLGIPFPGVHVSIRDRVSTAALPEGTDGEICIKGDSVFRGYLHDAPHGLPVRNGWLRTGDLGRERADGTFEYRGRTCENRERT